MLGKKRNSKKSSNAGKYYGALGGQNYRNIRNKNNYHNDIEIGISLSFLIVF